MYCDWPHLGRCCFCMPLRRGVLTFGYINMFLSAFMIGMYSFYIHNAESIEWLVFFMRAMALPSVICLIFYCSELIFNGLLIYGTHKKILGLIKAFYYYSLTTCLAVLTLEIIDISMTMSNRIRAANAIEKGTFAFAGFCLQIYLITLVRSLIRKQEVSESHVFDNQLQQIVAGEVKVEGNRIYNDTTVVPQY